MNIAKILACTDHAMLKPQTCTQDIINLCTEAIEYKTACVCVPLSYVRFAKSLGGKQLIVSTVIGFPFGYSSTKSKVYEAQEAIEHGASELDMVINIGALKDANLSSVESEIKQIKKVCENRILKVIIETCLLTNQEKIEMCKIVNNSGAEYLKTSTGFAGGGASVEDILLLKEYLDKNIKIKASGGIRSLEAAWQFLELGCERLGSSAIVNLARAAGYMP